MQRGSGQPRLLLSQQKKHSFDEARNIAQTIEEYSDRWHRWLFKCTASPVLTIVRPRKPHRSPALYDRYPPEVAETRLQFNYITANLVCQLFHKYGTRTLSPFVRSCSDFVFGSVESKLTRVNRRDTMNLNQASSSQEGLIQW